MIAFVRTANIAPGKTGSAIGFAHEMAAYLKSTHDLQMEVLRPIGGNPQRIAWSTRDADLAALEAVMNMLVSDKHYWEKIAKASDNFIAGSMNDAIWQTL
jgi:hypothetical protein